MTYKEAREIIENMCTTWSEDGDEALNTAIEALEKQIPKKPKGGTRIRTYDGYEFLQLMCPCCKEHGVGEIETTIKVRTNMQTFCSDCGQAIDWGEEE